MSASIEDSETLEAMLWSAVERVETLATRKYQIHSPTLLTDEKASFVQCLKGIATRADLVDESALNGPLDKVLICAGAPTEASALLVQGFVLELLGITLYTHMVDATAISKAGRRYADVGRRACESVLKQGRLQMIRQWSDGEKRYLAFKSEAEEVLASLEKLGEAVDQEFGEAFGLTFGDLIGDFAAELLDRGLALDMPRHKLIVFLTSCLMRG